MSAPIQGLREEVAILRKEKNAGPGAAYQNLYRECYQHFGKAGALQQVVQYAVRYQHKGNRLDLIKIALWVELLDECERGQNDQAGF